MDTISNLRNKIYRIKTRFPLKWLIKYTLNIKRGFKTRANKAMVNFIIKKSYLNYKDCKNYYQYKSVMMLIINNDIDNNSKIRRK